MVLFQPFSVDGHDYLYDTASNAIVKLPRGVGAWLDDVFSADRTPSNSAGQHPGRQAAAEFVERTRRRNGLFATAPKHDYRWILDPKRVSTQLEHGMRGLLLGLTDQCNQRCSYCIYSGNYRGSRTHGTHRMQWDVARRAIDMFVNRRNVSSPATVTFYGGEPLTAWDLVRKCTEYINSLGITDLQIVMNTNLTLLNESRAEFLAENSVGLAVSIDGPAHIHDSARVFTSGRPTHAHVLRWLTYLRNVYPSYWRDCVVLQATFNKESDLDEVFDFFCNDAWCDLQTSINGVRLADQRAIRYSRGTVSRHSAALDRLVSKRMLALESGESFAHPLFANLFQAACKDIPERVIGYAPEETHPMKTCIPGVARLYVDPHGSLFPCEKTDVPGACIGDIDSGINYTRVLHVLSRQVKFCESECDRCWAYRLCQMCLAHFLEGGNIRWRAARRRCRKQRVQVREALIRFVHMFNNEPPATWNHPFSLHRIVKDAKRP